MKFGRKAFTLVDLIVTITIAAILATIWFLSYQSYVKSSRDSVRLLDVWTLNKSFEYCFLDTGRYPDPDNYFNVTYSWVLLWKQWSIWEEVINQLNSVSKIPLDPKFLYNYTYSVSYDNQLYQIWLVAEGSRD